MTAKLTHKPYNQNGIYNPYYLNKTQLTNCVLEVPQNIDIQLDKTSKLLTCSEKSIAIFPDGFEEDGTTPKFLYKSGKKLTNNGSVYSHTTGLLGIAMVDNILNSIEVFPLNLIVSSNVMPTGSSPRYWYDTANNMCYIVQNGAIQRRASLPIAHFTGGGTGVGITNIDTVFNGAGFIDQIAWIDKGLKVLISNGGNADGTSRNREYITDKLYLSNHSGLTSRYMFLNLQNPNRLNSWGNCYQLGKEPVLTAGNALMFFNERTNYMERYDTEGTQVQVGDMVYLGSLVKFSTTGSITSLDLNIFKVLNPSEILELDEPDLSGEGKITVAYNTEYLVREPGWVYFNTHLHVNANYITSASSIQVYGRIFDGDKNLAVYGNLCSCSWDGSSQTVSIHNMTTQFVRVYTGQRVKLYTAETRGSANVASYQCDFYPLKKKGC